MGREQPVERVVYAGDLTRSGRDFADGATDLEWADEGDRGRDLPSHLTCRVGPTKGCEGPCERPRVVPRDNEPDAIREEHGPQRTWISSPEALPDPRGLSWGEEDDGVATSGEEKMHRPDTGATGVPDRGPPLNTCYQAVSITQPSGGVRPGMSSSVHHCPPVSGTALCATKRWTSRLRLAGTVAGRGTAPSP